MIGRRSRATGGPDPGTDADAGGRGRCVPNQICKKWQLFQRANQSGRKESASELTFFLGGAANEAAFARDAGTRDGGQRYWGGEQGDGHVCRALGWSEVGKGSLSYPPWVKSAKDLKISQPIFGFSVRRQNLDALAGDWTASGRENIQLVLPRSERETPGEAHI